MSTQTEFESLKQQIIEVVTKDPTIKYILVGWMTDEFVPKTDYSKILDEIKELREETKELREETKELRKSSDIRFQAVQNEIKELREETKELRKSSDIRFQAVQNEIKELREDSNKRFEEQAAETRALREETHHRFEELRTEMHEGFAQKSQEISDLRTEMQQGFKDLGQHMDRIGSRWGEDAEEAFKQGLIGLVREFFAGTISKWRIHDTDGFVHGQPCDVELDIVMVNGKCIVAEIKSSASHSDVTIFNRTAQLYERTTGVKPDRKALITPSIKPYVRDWAEELGILVLAPDQMKN